VLDYRIDRRYRIGSNLLPRKSEPDMRARENILQSVFPLSTGIDHLTEQFEIVLMSN